MRGAAYSSKNRKTTDPLVCIASQVRGYTDPHNQLLCKKMNPDEAYARFVLGKLSGDAIVGLANEWLDGGLYSESLGEIYTISKPVMSHVGPLFVSVMNELGIAAPSIGEAGITIAKFVLTRISDGCPNPLREVEFLYWHVHHELVKEFPDREYVGDNLGLEHVFCWLREIWDCRDGSRLLYYSELPRDQAEVKFFAHLQESAADWLCSTQQAGGDNTLSRMSHP